MRGFKSKPHRTVAAAEAPVTSCPPPYQQLVVIHDCNSDQGDGRRVVCRCRLFRGAQKLHGKASAAHLHPFLPRLRVASSLTPP